MFLQIIKHISELQKIPTSAETLFADDSLEMDFYHKMCFSSKRYILKYLDAKLTLMSLLSNKNTVSITESISILGKPQSIWLDDQEKALLLSLNISINGPVLVFPQNCCMKPTE